VPEPDRDPTTFTVPPEQDVHLIWLNAITKLPDAKPLVELLRGDLPMPLGIRDILAELLDPGEPDIMGGKLIFKKTSGIERVIGRVVARGEADELGTTVKVVDSELLAVFEYYKLIAEKQSSQLAAFHAGELHGVVDRTIYRFRDRLIAFGARLRGK
jgi:hypothetical protein